MKWIDKRGENKENDSITMSNKGHLFFLFYFTFFFLKQYIYIYIYIFFFFEENKNLIEVMEHGWNDLIVTF